MKIVFILPALSHPRHQKRIAALEKDYDLKIYAFDRGVYKMNSIDQEKVTVIGRMENKNYFKRLKEYQKVVSLIKKEKGKDKLFYFFSYDIALIGHIYLKKNTFIYEIGDFAYLGLNNVLKGVMSKIDLRIIKRSLFTVFTSNGFVSYINRGRKQLDENDFIVIPNKMPEEVKKIQRSKKIFENVSSIRFGFVGVLRYPNTVLRFVKIIGEKYPSHSFVFYGDGGLKKEFLELCGTHSNLEYGGAFKNPDDLERIYNDFDIHIACYDITGPNQQIAEPNKLYESIYFGNPLIATEGSYFGKRAKEMNVGYEIDASSDDNIIDFLNNLTEDSINEIKDNMMNISSTELINSNLALLEKLKNNK